MEKINTNLLQSSGFCETCQKVHCLEGSQAVAYCQTLMEKLDSEGRVDFDTPRPQADPAFTTEYLFGPARGQMFGVMAYLDANGNKRAAKAFSGQYNGRWRIPGWVDPIIEPDEFKRLTFSTEREIKKIGKKIATHPKGSKEAVELKNKRKKLSQALMREIHKIYRIKNFKGQQKSMPEIVCTTKGIPTGTGDCCAPKLLNFAACRGFTPLSIAEFYYGKENRSGSRAHKKFYPSCTDKCGLILGYMLCGL